MDNLKDFIHETARSGNERRIAAPGAHVRYISGPERGKGTSAMDTSKTLNQTSHRVPPPSNERISDPMLSSYEKELIRRQYLGDADGEAHKKPRRGERKVNFDWDEADDTTGIDLRELSQRPSLKSSTFIAEELPTTNRNRLEASIINTVDAYGNKIEIQVRDKSLSSRSLSLVDDRHWGEKRLEEMKERDWRILKEDFGITVSGGGNLPHPLRFWQEPTSLLFPSRLVDLIKQIGYGEPTPIQRQCIPLILAGRDVIGVAETGSGKTAAFILPMICQVLKLPPLRDEETILDGPYGLVLAPTRELVLQIENETKKFCQPMGLRVLSIVGGHSMAEQSVQLRRGAEILVATPGRLRDCLEQRVLSLRQCYNLVLDEADRMIDLNFEPDLQYILSCLSTDLEKPDSIMAEAPERLSGRYRQTTMFSATMPLTVEKLARAYLRRPAMVTVGAAGQAADTVEQKVEMIKAENKDKRLLEILDSEIYAYPIIIFVNQKKAVEFLYNRLQTQGYRCIALHGGKGQEQREGAIASIRRGQRDILIATDVAGRGIDIADVSLVVNYDMARSIEDYIHRIGRTGRMGRLGTAMTFLTLDDSPLFYELRSILLKASKSSIPEEFLQHEATRTKPGSVTQKRRNEERIYAYGV